MDLYETNKKLVDTIKEEGRVIEPKNFLNKLIEIKFYEYGNKFYRDYKGCFHEINESDVLLDDL
jgi:hypothetical protein